MSGRKAGSEHKAKRVVSYHTKGLSQVAADLAEFMPGFDTVTFILALLRCCRDIEDLRRQITKAVTKLNGVGSTPKLRSCLTGRWQLVLAFSSISNPVCGLH